MSKELNDYTYGKLITTSGYDVDFAVGTTYSLNPEALLIVPMALGMFSEVNDATKRSKILLLESIRRCADKFVLFCNRGSIHTPPEVQSFFPLLENCIFEVQNHRKPNSNFHPKVWIVKETNRMNPDDSQIKVVVMSRNLTLDNNLDMVVALTGKISKKPFNNPKHQPLINFLNKLMKQLPQPAENNASLKLKKQQIRNLAHDINYVERFEVDEDNFERDGYEFIPLFFGENLNQHLAKQIGKKYKKETGEPDDDILHAFKGESLMTISPFIDFRTLKTINENAKTKDNILVTTIGYLSKDIFDLYQHDNCQIYVMKDGMIDNDIMPTDLHAKTYLVCNPKIEFGNFLFVGSANATEPAFHANSEFILRLKYKPRKWNVYSDFRRDFLRIETRNNTEESAMFEQVLTPPDEIESHEYSELEKFLRKVVTLDFDATCVPNEDGTYSIVIKSDVNSDDFNLSIAPLQTPGYKEKLETETILKNLALNQLSEFYIFIAANKETEETIQKVIKISTKNLPTDERDKAIFRSCVNTKEEFLSYISFMLSDSPENYLLSLENAQQLLSGNAESSQNVTLPQPIYEQMLKTAFSNPQRLKEIDEVMEKIGNKDFLDDFKAVFKVFKSALNIR